MATVTFEQREERGKEGAKKKEQKRRLLRFDVASVEAHDEHTYWKHEFLTHINETCFQCWAFCI